MQPPDHAPDVETSLSAPGASATPLTHVLCPRSTRLQAPVRTSHSRTVPSSPAVAHSLPSSESCTQKGREARFGGRQCSASDSQRLLLPFPEALQSFANSTLSNNAHLQVVYLAGVALQRGAAVARVQVPHPAKSRKHCGKRRACGTGAGRVSGPCAGPTPHHDQWDTPQNSAATGPKPPELGTASTAGRLVLCPSSTTSHHTVAAGRRKPVSSGLPHNNTSHSGGLGATKPEAARTERCRRGWR